MQACAKIEAENIIKRLPDTATLEDIQYHLYIAERIRNSREQIKKGQLYSQSDVEKRLEKWIIK